MPLKVKLIKVRCQIKKGKPNVNFCCQNVLLNKTTLPMPGAPESHVCTSAFELNASVQSVVSDRSSHITWVSWQWRLLVHIPDLCLVLMEIYSHGNAGLQTPVFPMKACEEACSHTSHAPWPQGKPQPLSPSWVWRPGQGHPSRVDVSVVCLSQQLPPVASLAQPASSPSHPSKHCPAAERGCARSIHFPGPSL